MICSPHNNYVFNSTMNFQTFFHISPKQPSCVEVQNVPEKVSKVLWKPSKLTKQVSLFLSYTRGSPVKQPHVPV